MSPLRSPRPKPTGLYRGYPGNPVLSVFTLARRVVPSGGEVVACPSRSLCRPADRRHFSPNSLGSFARCHRSPARDRNPIKPSSHHMRSIP